MANKLTTPVWLIVTEKGVPAHLPTGCVLAFKSRAAARKLSARMSKSRVVKANIVTDCLSK
jgi:hypothetical protein